MKLYDELSAGVEAVCKVRGGSTVFKACLHETLTRFLHANVLVVCCGFIKGSGNSYSD